MIAAFVGEIKPVFSWKMCLIKKIIKTFSFLAFKDYQFSEQIILFKLTSQPNFNALDWNFDKTNQGSGYQELWVGSSKRSQKQ